VPEAYTEQSDASEHDRSTYDTFQETRTGTATAVHRQRGCASGPANSLPFVLKAPARATFLPEAGFLDRFDEIVPSYRRREMRFVWLVEAK
jgi:hypothetical protein